MSYFPIYSSIIMLLCVLAKVCGHHQAILRRITYIYEICQCIMLSAFQVKVLKWTNKSGSNPDTGFIEINSFWSVN